MSRFLKRKIGIAFWAIAFVAIALGVKPLRKATTNDGDVSLMKYFSGPTQRVVVDDETMTSELHDPVFYEDASGKWRQIGYVSKLGDPDTDPGQVQLSWYSSQISPSQCELYQYRSTGTLKEVLATMLPPEKQLRIQQRLSAALSEHGDDLSQAFVPLVQQSLKQSMPVIEAEFRKTIDQHREEINQLATRFNDEIVEQQLIPLAKEEIMPIVRKHGQPPAEEIGREIWDRASLWRFGWRAVYDKTPLPEKRLVQEEWKRFVESEAVPVIEEKMDDIVIAVQRIFSDVAVNPTIRAEIAGVADELAKDPEVTALVRTILRETLVENDRLRAVWSEVWTSEEANAALELAGDRLEPIVREIGDELFGNEKTGIDPNFARVLRSQILRKDRRWIVAWHTGEPASGVIQASRKQMPYPIVYTADAVRDDFADEQDVRRTRE